MSGLSIDEPGSIDTQMQEVQQELETSRSKIQTLEKNLAERDKKIERLEAEARTQRKRWLDESRAQGQQTNNLRAELEAKANNVAYLTTEMHKLKQRLKTEQSGDQGDSGKVKVSGSSHPSHSMGQGPASQPGYLHPDAAQSSKSSFGQHHIPTPPAREKTLGGSSASRIRRSGHSRSVVGGVSGKAIASGSHPTSASADALMGRQANPLRLSSGRSSGSESPDISPFLHHTKEEFVQVVGGKQAPILPPIASSGAIGGGAHPVLVHQVVSSTSQHRQKTKSSAANDAAIVSLAVENAVPDSAWNIAHESRSTEFN